MSGDRSDWYGKDLLNCMRVLSLVPRPQSLRKRVWCTMSKSLTVPQNEERPFKSQNEYVIERKESLTRISSMVSFTVSNLFKPFSGLLKQGLHVPAYLFAMRIRLTVGAASFWIDVDAGIMILLWLLFGSSARQNRHRTACLHTNYNLRNFKRFELAWCTSNKLFYIHG